MIVRKLRLDRGWSQEQLADFTGISVRTIQRLERGQKPGLETAKALAAVFETDVSTFLEVETSTPEREAQAMTATDNPPAAEISNENRVRISKEEKEALRYVRDLKGFYSHAMFYAVIMGGLAIINLISGGPYWFIWPALGWGLGVASHGMSVYEMWNFFSPSWEKRQIEKRLNR